MIIDDERCFEENQEMIALYGQVIPDKMENYIEPRYKVCGYYNLTVPGKLKSYKTSWNSMLAYTSKEAAEKAKNLRGWVYDWKMKLDPIHEERLSADEYKEYIREMKKLFGKADKRKDWVGSVSFDMLRYGTVTYYIEENEEYDNLEGKS